MTLTIIIGSCPAVDTGAFLFSFFSFFSFFGFSSEPSPGTFSLTGDLGRSLSLYPRSNLRSPSSPRPSSSLRLSFHLNPPPPRFGRSSSRLRLGDLLLRRSSRRGDGDLDLVCGPGIFAEAKCDDDLHSRKPRSVSCRSTLTLVSYVGRSKHPPLNDDRLRKQRIESREWQRRNVQSANSPKHTSSVPNDHLLYRLECAPSLVPFRSCPLLPYHPLTLPARSLRAANYHREMFGQWADEYRTCE